MRRLDPLATPKCPLVPDKNLPGAVTWARPELVCEVKFSNWTDDGRLRAPVFLGLRPDIDPSECVREPVDGAERTTLEQTTLEQTRLLDPKSKEVTRTIDRHSLKFTNLDKLYYPKDGIRKGDLLNYYDAVAPLLIPHLKDRPLSLKRYPNGIDSDFSSRKRSRRAFRSGCERKRLRMGSATRSATIGPRCCFW